jgi:oxygen-independent coproporphyrinogen III oxidase
MAGIYIHIPFCRRKCHYCDFYRTTSLLRTPGYLEALSLEISQRAEYLNNDTVETIYFGGGTPSVLSPGEISAILERLNLHFSIDKDVETTLEANPDDLSEEYLNQIKQVGINRISIGIQSLTDRNLKLMNRRHSAAGAVQSINDAFHAGFSDISIDLIFGIPGQTIEEWIETLNLAVQFPINHISAYHLTYHEETLFKKWLNNGKIKELPEDESITLFEALFSVTSEAGFEQYEISNFAKKQAYSKHNSGYWLGKNYLGLGPSAHSFNGSTRQWNISVLEKYITGVLSGNPVYSTEVLSEKDKLNDYIITGIRTKWGISIDHIREKFGDFLADRVIKSALAYESKALVKIIQGVIKLTQKGILVSDQITLDFLFL